MGSCGQPPLTSEKSVERVKDSSAIASGPAKETAALIKLDVAHLPNAYQLHPKVISGGLPEGEPAFHELQELGIKTVISVDGAKPDVELAKKYGMRYVHLPHGYDGIPDRRVAELAKAVRDLPGPIYLHCHHGKHRSPAAATAACVAAGFVEPQAALGILKTAGTSENYRGLYQSATEARRLPDPVLDELKVDFPEVAKLPKLAEAMVAIEHRHENLKVIAASGWKPPPHEPALDPAHESLLLREQFSEMLRSEDTRRRPSSYRRYLEESEKAALELEARIREWNKAGSPVLSPTALEKSFAAITDNCAVCHREHRDIPLREKNGIGKP